MTEAKSLAQYLGDGVYANWDGWHVVLTTGTHEEEKADNLIYLDSATLRQLEAYVERLRGQLEERAP